MENIISMVFRLSPKAVILTAIFIDIAGMAVVIPILPYYAVSFGASALTVTTLFATYAACSFVSAPFLGALSDRYGRKPIMLVSIASTAIGWMVFALASNIWFLFLGRIIDGMAAGNIGTARSLLLDLAGDNRAERLKAIGLVGTIFGIGFVVGPLVGGIFGHVNNQLPFFLVAIAATLNFIFAALSLTETKEPDHTYHVSMNPFRPLVLAVHDHARRLGYISWFLMLAATGIFHSIFALYMAQVFGLEQIAVGLLMALVGAVMIVSQVWILPKSFHWFGERRVESFSLWGLAIGYSLMVLPSLPVFIIGLILTAIGQSAVRITLNHALVEGEVKRQGEIMGVTGSLMSAAMIAGPLFAGMVFVKHISLPLFMAAGVSLLAWIAALLYRNRLAALQAQGAKTVLAAG